MAFVVRHIGCAGVVLRTMLLHLRLILVAESLFILSYMLGVCATSVPFCQQPLQLWFCAKIWLLRLQNLLGISSQNGTSARKLDIIQVHTNIVMLYIL